VAEDGGSGDTEAQADSESDGGDDGGDDENSDDASDNSENDENSGDGSDSSDDGSDSSDDGSDNSDDSSSDSHDGSSNSDDSSSHADSGSGSDAGVEVDAYPGDSAPKEQVAAWMATQARKRGLPGELPIMASMVESGLKNLPGGDADSVGYFQMRVSVWNHGDYAGYPDKPEKQLDWFLDQAAAVKKQRAAAGQPMDSAHYGDWIADVERPAAQYRGRYQPMLDDAQSLLHKAKGSSGSGASDAADGASFNPSQHDGVQSPTKMVSVASKVGKLGLPYKWGGGHGATPAPIGTPVDCSGYVSQILGVTPRTSGGFMSFGKAGAGKHVTIYANQEHVFIQIDDRYFSTSHSNPGGGAGEVPRPDPSYLARFVKRHPRGL
jgi:hypothetical protein